MINHNPDIGLETEAECEYNGKIISAALRYLVERKILPHANGRNREFAAFLNKVSAAFIIDESAITTRMARLLYNISSITKPRNVLVVGSYKGNSLVWIAGGCDSEATCVGIDVNNEVNSIARSNFSSIGMTNVQLYDLDGHDAGNLFLNDIDMILLDADAQDVGKKIYTSLTNVLWPKLKPGGFLLAHDIIWPAFQNDLKDFRCLISDKKLFTASAIIPIDRYGICICRKVS